MTIKNPKQKTDFVDVWVDAIGKMGEQMHNKKEKNSNYKQPGYKIVESCNTCNHVNKDLPNHCDLYDCICHSYRSVCNSHEVKTDDN